MTAWEYGMDLIERGDVEGGLAVLQRVVTHKPRDVGQREALRKIEREIRSEQKGDKEPSEPALLEVWWEIQQSRHKQEFADWEAIDRAAERGLAIDPWNVELHLELGHACRERGYTEAARFAYTCARELAPDRGEINEYLGLLSKR
jgi:Flp pilus assembly protein TadD